MVKSGLDTLDKQLSGQRVGLVTNQTGLNRQFKRTATVLAEKGAHLAALFGPEHGYYGVEQDAIPVTEVTKDSWSGVPVYSLYRSVDLANPAADSFGPPPGSLDGLDALVFDIQDVGCRFYTYPTTLGILMEQVELPIYVVDRPNPIGGELVEGPYVEPGYSSFVGRYPQIPVRHGLTQGELAEFINRYLLDGKAKLEVLKMEGWRRGMTWEETGLPWLATSPNLPTITTARLYPGTCLIEGTNLSVGRGTTQPFELVGAPWIEQPERLAAELNRLGCPGLYFRDTFFKPIYEPFAGEVCGGVQVHVAPAYEDNPNGPDYIVRSGLLLVATIARLYPEHFHWLPAHFDRLIGSDVPRRIIAGENNPINSVADLFQTWFLQETRFRESRQRVLFY
ncbi:MAG: DUF1343 domain-containing protein [Chloroflexi bacterium]|nr:DUF1343 domain-containing protein [Chloroflexota bacterium]OJV95099.1 MAG: hypothetical protein BGO39_24075 [Chloroflexi bacterium 54-19]